MNKDYKVYSQSIFSMNKPRNLSRGSILNNHKQHQVFNYASNEAILEQSREESSRSFTNIAGQIYSSQFFNNRNKHIKIKLQAWMQVLQKYEYNSVWRTNKLNYLKLLNLMCQCQCLVHPFTSFPQQNNLPILKKHEMERIMDNVEKEIKSQTKINIQSQLTSVKNRKNSYYNKSKPVTRRQDQYWDQTKLKNRFYQHQSLPRKVGLKSDQQINDEIQDRTSASKIIIQQQEFTISKSKRMQYKLQQQQQNQRTKNKSFTSQLLKIQEQRYSDKSSSKYDQNYSFNSNKKKNNSISNSISLEMSPISVSSKVWQYTKKKERQCKRFNQTVDLSKILKTTVDSIKKEEEGRQSYPTRQFETPTIEWGIAGNRQYWQSNTFTGNATPNYINNFKHIANMSINESQQVLTFRSDEKRCCECSFWNNII